MLFRLRWFKEKIDFKLKGFGDSWKVFTHLTVEERLLLYHLGKKRPQGAVFVEIGSYLGASSCFLAAAAHEREGVLHCVDTWNNEGMTEGQRDTWGEFCQNTLPFSDKIMTHRGKSIEIAKMFKSKIDLLFVDGDHNYEMCKADMEAWLPHLKKGGILIMHDYGWADGVRKVVDEIVKQKQTDNGQVMQNTYWTTL